MEDALAEYRRAVKLETNLALPEMNLSKALKSDGDFEGAIAECRQALRLHPDDPSVLADVGHELDDEKRFVEALTESNPAPGFTLGASWSPVRSWKNP